MSEQQQDGQILSLGGAIDVHGHYLTDTYRRGLADAGITQPDGFPHIPDWSAVRTIELMDELDISAMLLSVSSPGVFFGDGRAARRLAQEMNDEGAEIVSVGDGRFGLLACLPLPDVDASLHELRRCFDELNVDGVALLTNYGGAYLGDDGHEDLFAELDSRHAVVLLHPTSPPGWEKVALGRPRPMIEFPIDTTRTVIRLVLDGVPQRYPNIRFIVPHVGAALPAFVDRVVVTMGKVFEQLDNPIDVLGALRNMYYDVAGTALPRALPALLNMVDADRLLFATDAPFPPTPVITGFAADLMATSVLDEHSRRAMLHENALALFPRFAQLAPMGSRA